mgnify:CR=1 FL=1
MVSVKGPRSDKGEPPPKIEFPCDYPITIMGDASEDFVEHVVTVVKRHDASFSAATVRSRDSRHGRYRSVRLVIRATGPDQLQALHEALQATGRVRMVI